MLREKLQVLEQLRQGLASEPNAVTEGTVKALLESLNSELHTEIGFSTHLSQMIEKLNGRRSEQDREIFAMGQKLADSEARMSRLEVEKAEVRAQMDRLSAELAQRDRSLAAANDTAANLQQALQSKQRKIEEQKKYCVELKAALEQCQASMSGVRRNEEIIRKHVAAQDQEIRRLRGQYELSMREKSGLVQKGTELEAQVVSLKANLKERLEEGEKLKAEIRDGLQAREKLARELKGAKEGSRKLEEDVAARRREKELVMTNCCRLMEDNKRLHAETQRLSQICASSRSGDAAVQALQGRVDQQNAELSGLRTQLAQAEGRLTEAEARLADALAQKERLQEELSSREDRLSTLKAEMVALEKSKRDITAQMSRFAQQANELKSHLRRVEAERVDLETRLRSEASSYGSPAAADMKRQLGQLSTNLERAQAQLRALERERDVLNEDIKLEKTRTMRMEERCNQERAKLAEQQSIINVRHGRGSGGIITGCLLGTGVGSGKTETAAGAAW